MTTTPTTPTPVIVINGKEYPGPTTDDLSFDELEIAERLGAPMPRDDEEPDLRHVRWLRALVTIALTRAEEDADYVGTIRVSQVEFKNYPEVNGGPPPNRAARRSRAVNGATAKPGNAKIAAGSRDAQPASSGNQPTATTSA